MPLFTFLQNSIRLNFTKHSLAGLAWQKTMSQCEKQFLFLKSFYAVSFQSGEIQQKVCNIWQQFLYLLDERISKIWKKFNSDDGFLSHLVDSTANSVHLAAIFSPLMPSKSLWELNFLHIFAFAIASSSRHEKIMSNAAKTFCCIFTTLETYCV